MDKETQEILAEGDKIEEFVKSQYWETVKKRLTDKIEILDKLSSLPVEGDIHTEIKIRKGAISLVEEWIAEIEGASVQHQQNRKVLTEAPITQTFE